LLFDPERLKIRKKILIGGNPLPPSIGPKAQVGMGMPTYDYGSILRSLNGIPPCRSSVPRNLGSVPQWLLNAPKVSRSIPQKLWSVPQGLGNGAKIALLISQGLGNGAKSLSPFLKAWGTLLNG
jgi:hypothetical protein